MGNCGVVVVAAGSGRRFGGSKPKQFINLCGKPLVWWCLRAFNNSSLVSDIVLVLPPGHVEYGKRLAAKWKFGKLRKVLGGGVLRVESVFIGVNALPKWCDPVVIHDGVRPLVDQYCIARVAQGALKYGVSLAGIPVGDTLKKIDSDNIVIGTVPRKDIWQAQTPQGFTRKAAEKIFSSGNLAKKLAGIITDDVQLAEVKRFKVKMVSGSPFNIKITYPKDIELCTAFIKGRS